MRALAILPFSLRVIVVSFMSVPVLPLRSAFLEHPNLLWHTSGEAPGEILRQPGRSFLQNREREAFDEF